MYKKILFSIFICLFSLHVFGQSWGEKRPCPGVIYTYNIDLGFYVSGSRDVNVSINGGRNPSGQSYFSVLNFSGQDLMLDVIWDDTPYAQGSIEARWTTGGGFPTYTVQIRSLWKVKPTVTFKEISSTSRTPLQVVDNSVTIPRGQSGSFKLTASAVFPSMNEPVTEFYWWLNSNNSVVAKEYILNYNEDDSYSIVVSPKNSYCPDVPNTSYGEDMYIFNVGRSGDKDNQNIENQNIIKNGQIVAKKTINFSNSSVTNNATVNMIAGQEITITPNSEFLQGTNVHLWIEDLWAQDGSVAAKSIRSGSIDENIEPEQNVNHLDEVAVASPLSIYPNPVSDVLNIDSEVPVISVKVYNSIAGLVKTFGNVENSINLSDLLSGMYTVVIQTNQKIKIFKVIKK